MALEIYGGLKRCIMGFVQVVNACALVCSLEHRQPKLGIRFIEFVWEN